MHRRRFVTLTTATAALVLGQPAWAAYRAQSYAPGMIGDLRNSDRTAILNFNASWSYTCQFKREAIAALKAANPDYLAHIDFVDIDWDTYGPSQMAERLKVERHSTLVALRGQTEIGRIVAERNPERLRSFLDLTLAAARA